MILQARLFCLGNQGFVLKIVVIKDRESLMSAPDHKKTLRESVLRCLQSMYLGTSRRTFTPIHPKNRLPQRLSHIFTNYVAKSKWSEVHFAGGVGYPQTARSLT